MSDVLTVRVAARQQEALAIISLVLQAKDGEKLPSFKAGDHIDLHLDGGLVRQYSLCNAPADTTCYRLAVLLAAGGRGGSKYVHENLQVGAEIAISPPRSNFSLSSQRQMSILLAGGIGITPLLSMAHQLSADGDPFEMHYFARSRAHCAFAGDIAKAPFSGSVAFHFDDEPELAFDPTSIPEFSEGSNAYICGPSGFIEAMTDRLVATGWPRQNVHFELFNANIDMAGDEFTVVARRSGKSVQVPADTSILAALSVAGIHADCSCEQGVCGTCLTTVLQGVPDHKDMYQTDEEKQTNQQIALCCSRSLTPVLVLDI